jgi:hypothetical protein
MIIKEDQGWGDEQLEQCNYNLLIRSAPSLFNPDDSVPFPATYYLFRYNIVACNGEHDYRIINLWEECNASAYGMLKTVFKQQYDIDEDKNVHPKSKQSDKRPVHTIPDYLEEAIRESAAILPGEIESVNAGGAYHSTANQACCEKEQIALLLPTLQGVALGYDLEPTEEGNLKVTDLRLKTVIIAQEATIFPTGYHYSNDKSRYRTLAKHKLWAYSQSLWINQVRIAKYAVMATQNLYFSLKYTGRIVKYSVNMLIFVVFSFVDKLKLATQKNPSWRFFEKKRVLGGDSYIK